MKFLRLGDMTLFICFVRSSLFLPTTSSFWNQCVHGSRQRNRMFLWHSHSKFWASSENNRLIEEKTGALPALFQQVERFWVTAELRIEPVFPQLCRSWNSARRHLDGSDQLPPSSRWQRLEVRGAIPWSLEGRPAQTRSHTRRKTPRLIIITFYEHSTQSVSHSDTAQGCQCAM